MARKDKTETYNYILDYIDESIKSRSSLSEIARRSINAYQGECYVNSYKAAMANYGGTLDKVKRSAFNKMCEGIQEKKSFVVFNAVETVVSMAMGGASQFEFAPYDKYLEADEELIDRQRAAAEHFYSINKMDAIMPQAVRALSLGGAAYIYINPEESEDGTYKISLLESYRMLTDPIRNKTNRPRFIGFTQTESWKAVKDSIYKDNKSGYMLKTINGVDAYLSEVQMYLGGSSTADNLPDYIGSDVDIFYGKYKTNNKKKIDSNSKEKIDEGYQGDEIEVAYLYDLCNKMYFRVVNRRFIVVAQNNPLSKKITIPYYDSNGKKKTRTKEVYVDSPIVEIPYIKNSWETYPISPLFYMLDDFDTICSIETLLAHNLSIMSPINFLGSSYDAEIISKSTQIAGEIIEGTLSQTGVFNKGHDLSPALAAIQRYEDRIKRVMGATDQYELQAMIGNRATASEVSSANGAVSQRLNQLLANIEAGMSELTEKFFKMWIIFNGDKALPFSNKGKYDEIDAEEMSVDCLVRGKLKSAIKLEQAEQSRNAMQLIGFLSQNESINKEEFFSTMIPIAVQGVVTRRQAEKFVFDEETVAVNKAKNAEALAPPTQEAPAKQIEQTPEDAIVGGLDLSFADPAFLEDLLMKVRTGQPLSEEETIAATQIAQQQSAQQGVNPTQQAPMQDISTADIPPGMSPNDAGLIANQSNGVY